MNIFTRVLTTQKFLFSIHHHSRKGLISPHSITTLQQFSLFSTTNDFQNTIRLKTQNPKKPRSSKSSSESSPSAPSLSWSQRVKKQSEALPSWRKPSEIPYQEKVANSVNFIGTVEMPVLFHATPDGKHMAATFVTSGGKSSLSLSSSSLKIPVVFEGDLAHIVACHVKQNDFVYVTGKLCVEPLPFVLSEDQGKFHVLGLEINFVQASASKGSGLAVDEHVSRLDNVESKNRKNDVVAKGDAPSGGGAKSVEKLWEEVFARPDEWWVIKSRSGGLDGEIIGFECKDTGDMLHTDAFTPWWVYKKVGTLQFDEKVYEKIDEKRFSDVGATGDRDTDDMIHRKGPKNVGTAKDEDSILSSWRDLVKNPKDWWDHRVRKSSGLVKAKFPDFKHKTNGTALWLNTAPKWVLPGLQGLVFDVQGHKVQQGGGKGDDQWKSLVENPDKWWDNRLDKINARAPDFKHKETGEVLWLNGSPAWVNSKLPPLKNKKTVAGGGGGGGKSPHAI